MKLIADSGSTKTEWKLIDKGQILNSFITIGMNPYFIKSDEIHTVVENMITPFIDKSQISGCYFYGSGCLAENNKLIVNEALSKSFGNAKIEVETDIVGAARALFQKSKGIACILGTGSNSCLYDGEKIIESVPSLGYIFGDEGGGVHIGKKLITAFLHNDLPNEISEKLISEFNLNRESILNSVYKEKYPNRYLASFSHFIKDNIDNYYIENIVKESFRDFLKFQISKYSDFQKTRISFIGSISYYFKEQLKYVLNESGLELFKVMKSPMDGLVEYHS
ncbi:MAG: hypothetical protein K9J13_17285 [Saprospiraceae bacterium]|nr:hypothetical protein [Saprospiraceae bacterium]